MKECIHVIPVGGAEPVHVASVACDCHPLVGEEGEIVHNAWDLREVRERFGRGRPNEQWVIVGAPLEAGVSISTT